MHDKRRWRKSLCDREHRRHKAEQRSGGVLHSAMGRICRAIARAGVACPIGFSFRASLVRPLRGACCLVLFETHIIVEMLTRGTRAHCGRRQFKLLAI